MKIAQVAPLIESVPPRLYGGTERIVSYLTDELVRLGHDVTLFASGDSISSAVLAPCCTRALRLDAAMPDDIPHSMLMIDKVRQRAEEFDVLHFHIDLFHFPLFRSLASRTLTTLHGRQDLGDLGTFYSRFREMPLVSISDDQRKPLPHAKFMTTIQHGIPADLHRPLFENGKYFAFLGRISPEKRPDRAIRIARDAGIPLKPVNSSSARQCRASDPYKHRPPQTEPPRSMGLDGSTPPQAHLPRKAPGGVARSRRARRVQR